MLMEYSLIFGHQNKSQDHNFLTWLQICETINSSVEGKSPAAISLPVNK